MLTSVHAPRQEDQQGCGQLLCPAWGLRGPVPVPGWVRVAVARRVKPGGWLFFSTLNRNPKSFLFAIVGAEYVLNLLPRGTHEYRKFIRPSELARDCREAGLEVAHTRGLGHHPVTTR